MYTMDHADLQSIVNLKFGAILSQTYKNMTLSAPVPKRVLQFASDKLQYTGMSLTREI